MKAQRTAGFTIIEMLVVVAVVGVVATIIAVSFVGTDSSQRLTQARTVLSADVHTVLTWAQSGKIEESTGTTPYGYGIVFWLIYPGPDTKDYSIFADLNDNGEYDPGEPLIKEVNFELDELLEDITLIDCTPTKSPGIVMGPPPPPTQCELYVETQSGDITAVGAATGDMEITLQHTATLDQEVISINTRTGQLY